MPSGLIAFAASVAAVTWVTTPALADAQTVTFNPGLTQMFTSTGAEQQYVVPAGVTALHVVAIGGAGNSGSTAGGGGFGHRVEGDVAVTPGSTVYVEVGGNGHAYNDPDNSLIGKGGFNGGGDGAGGGGGASDLRTLPRSTALTTSDTRLIVAAGGGGGGSFTANTPGAGGNAEANGGDSTSGIAGGKAGTAADGGDGGASGGSICGSSAFGTKGQRGQGGSTGLCDFPGGGGGGGLWGGGGGEAAGQTASGGGGGGSSLEPVGGTKDITLFAPSITITAAEQSFTVPERVTSVHVVATGGHGGSSAAQIGGRADQVTADLAVTPGQTLYVDVGGNGSATAGGANGGGGGGTGGGGASDVRTASRAAGLAPDPRILVAAGGGGAGTDGSSTLGADGGDAGTAGADTLDANPSNVNHGAQPGTASAGGLGASGGVGSGTDGTLAQGGLGGGGDAYGGGGGGGLYGGGGAGGGSMYGGGGGGGGGSSLTAGGTKALVPLTSTPKVEITYTQPPAPVTETPPPGGTTPPPGGTTPPPTNLPLKLGSGGVIQGAGGTLTLTFNSPAPGVLESLGTYAKGKAGHAAILKIPKGQLLYSRAKKTVKAGKVVIKLKPTKAAKRALAKRKKLVVKLTTRLTPTTGNAVTVKKTVTVKFKKKR